MMGSIRELVCRIRSFFRKREMDDDFQAELSAHLDLLTQDNLKQGISPGEARRRALISVGGLEPARELHRESRGLPALDTILQDLRYCSRTMRREAGLTTFAILIVGLGVGASSTVFSVFHALLVRPLPFGDPARLAWIANDTGVGLSAQTVRVGHLQEFRRQNQSFSDVAAYYAFYGVGDNKLTGSGEPERLTAVPVTENFFRLLGVKPQVGRLFTPEECKINGPRAVLLSHGLWERRFARDPAVVGRPLTLDNAPVTVVGVLPAAFDFATVFAPGQRIDMYSPFPLSPETDRMGNTSALIGHLKPGTSIESAQAEAVAVGNRITQLDPNGNVFQPKVSGLRDHVSGQFRYAILVLAVAVGVVMLIVCANLSNLLLARTSARQKEIAIRTALGAGKRRLVRQMLTESVVLSCCGAALGLLLAFGGTRLVARLDAFSIPLLGQVRVDTTALGFTLLIAVVTGIAFGLMPALQMSGVSPQHAMKENSRGSTDGKRHGWIRGSLVVCEIAFACVLVAGAGLLIRSFLRVLEVDLGFRPERAVSLRIDPGSEYSTQAKRNAYFDEALRRVSSLPGVQAAGLTDALPLGSNRSWGVAAKGREYRRDEYPTAFVRIVSDDYLKALGIPLLAGRDFTPADAPSSTPVIIINETLARKLWPGEDPLGKILRTDQPERRVVGIVRDVRHLALEQEAGAEVYLPIRQTDDYSSVDVVVRGTNSPAALASAVRLALKPLDPNLPANEFRTIQQLVDKSISPCRFVVLMLAGFAGFALVLASLGIYGVISYSVNQRKQEIGIRMALGASAGELQRRVVVHTLKLAAIGIAVGAAAAWMLGRALQGLLFGVTSTDPATFGSMVVILTSVAALAGYLPARRASRMAPVAALRVD